MSYKAIVGMGDFFELVNNTCRDTCPDESIVAIEVPQHADYQFDLSVLDQLEPGCTSMYVAVDDRFGNFKRMELMQFVMERGFKLNSFIHPRAIIGRGAVIGPNVFVGPNVVIEHGVRIDFNTVVHANVYIGALSRIRSSCWIERGVSLGTRVEIGAHTIVRVGAQIATGVKVGRGCELGWPINYSSDVNHKTIYDFRYSEPIYTYGA